LEGEDWEVVFNSEPARGYNETVGAVEVEYNGTDSIIVISMRDETV
jgi:hypothetical protein